MLPKKNKSTVKEYGMYIVEKKRRLRGAGNASKTKER